MRYLARISALGMLGLGLHVAPAAGNAAESGVANLSKGISGSQLPIAPSPKNSGGGYSWSDKRHHSKQNKSSKRIDPLRPLLQAPNFELRPDGSSVVTLSISKVTDVTRTTKGRFVEYRLKDAQVGVHNNMNPLVTAHFNTPLDRVMLRRTDNGAALVLVLRESVQPLHQVRNVAAGGALLEITLPRATRSHAPVAVPPSEGAAPREAKAASAASVSRRHGRRVKTPVSPGPNP